MADVHERYGGSWSEWQVREFARTGRIPHRKPAGTNRLLFLAAELDQWDDGAPLEIRRLPKGGRVVVPASQERKSA
ncbi:MAG TPA: hypothetical protein VGH82_17220 [Gaiellaceae bacterium]